MKRDIFGSDPLGCLGGSVLNCENHFMYAGGRGSATQLEPKGTRTVVITGVIVP